jgi:hypothetical protein
VREYTRHRSIADPPSVSCNVDRGNQLSEESHAGLRDILSRTATCSCERPLVPPPPLPAAVSGSSVSGGRDFSAIGPYLGPEARAADLERLLRPQPSPPPTPPAQRANSRRCFIAAALPSWQNFCTSIPLRSRCRVRSVVQGLDPVMYKTYSVSTGPDQHNYPGCPALWI